MDLLCKHEIPHRKIYCPMGIRTSGPVLDMLNRSDYPMSFEGTFVEEIHVRKHAFSDMKTWEESLATWNRDFTMFIYQAQEFYEPHMSCFPNALEALAAWMSIDQLIIFYYVSERTDKEFEQLARKAAAIPERDIFW